MGQRIQRVLSDTYPEAYVQSFDEGDDLSFVALDVVIDFSLPAATQSVLRAVSESSAVLVSGVTGHSPEALTALQDLAKTHAVLTAANFSLGVHVTSHLVRQAAQMLDARFQIELFERHHQFKKDLPSGTALFLGAAAAQGRGQNWSDVYVDRQREQSRQTPCEIGVSALRGGSVIGAHSVHFLGVDEEIEIVHTVTDRNVFATGAIRAAAWLVEQSPGRYTMSDFIADTLTP
jgi:4-hydroxy-tetrahydrodipicolinate reductase